MKYKETRKGNEKKKRREEEIRDEIAEKPITQVPLCYTFTRLYYTL